MYSKTQFAHLLEGLPRGVFDKLVRKNHADKYSKGFRCWDQFVALSYAQFTRCRSLRELESSFNAQAAHHYHLGTRPIKRSTLADANAKRDSRIYEAACQHLLQGVHRGLRRELGNMLYLMDSSPIVLEGNGFDDWAGAYRNHRKQGLKLHMMIEAHNESIPCYTKITGMQVSDIRIGQRIPLTSEATYVFDRGYYSYNWWYRIDQLQSTFVTRLKSNANITVQCQHLVAASAQNILADETIQLNNRYVKAQTEKNLYHNKPLRRITVKNDSRLPPLVIVTNDFDRSASEVAALYKKRWEIELFFKWIKQNLRLKHFLGRSENAVKIQIYISLISYLLLYLYRKKHGITMSMKLLLSTLKVSLFQRKRTEDTLARRRSRWRAEIASLQGSFAF